MQNMKHIIASRFSRSMNFRTVALDIIASRFSRLIRPITTSRFSRTVDKSVKTVRIEIVSETYSNFGLLLLSRIGEEFFYPPAQSRFSRFGGAGE